jgi:adenylate cyclase
MAREVERKFLLADESWRAQVSRSVPMRQGYLAGNARASVRVRIQGGEAYLNIKSARLGVEREEFEYPVPVADAERMLSALAAGPVLTKTRHYAPYGEHTWEIDEFHGDNAGLVVAEIELGEPDEAFARPPWLGREVSDDPRYYSVNLVTHPYSRW